MRALFLSHTARPSGAELALFATVSALPQEESIVLFGQQGPIQKRIEAAGIPAPVVPMPSALADFDRRDVKPGLHVLRAAGYGATYLRRLYRAARELQPDVIVSNSSKTHLLGFLLSLRMGVPLVSIVRDRVTTEFYSRWGVHLLRAGLRTIPVGLIANSMSTAATVPIPWRRGQTRAVIPSPVIAPPQTFMKRAPRSEESAVLRIGVAGRLSPWKGQHVVIEAFASAFAPGQAELHLLGGALFGEQDYEDSLHRLANSLGVAPHVIFHGHADDVYAHMASWDMCVHSSIIPEPFGQVVVQAMLMSLPTLATAAGGPVETIDDGVDGILYPPGDVAVLATWMRRLSQDESLRSRLGAAARTSAQRFLPDAVAPAIAEALQSAAAQAHGRRLRGSGTARRGLRAPAN